MNLQTVLENDAKRPRLSRQERAAIRNAQNRLNRLEEMEQLVKYFRDVSDPKLVGMVENAMLDWEKTRS